MVPSHPPSIRVVVITLTHPLVAQLESHISALLDDPRLGEARAGLLERGAARVAFLAPDAVKKAVAQEAEELMASHGTRRDLVFHETGNTPRRMRNLRHDQIAEFGSVIPAVYSAPGIRAALATIAGDEVLECPYLPERFVITELEQSGDTHGWHWDDYSLALVWVVECPPIELGGFVQCVPRTSWNKNDPQLPRWFVSRPIYSMELAPGDLYLMRTDTTMHRVYPITGGRRLIINMAYAAPRDLARPMTHETMDNLWA